MPWPTAGLVDSSSPFVSSAVPPSYKKKISERAAYLDRMTWVTIDVDLLMELIANRLGKVWNGAVRREGVFKI